MSAARFFFIFLFLRGFLLLILYVLVVLQRTLLGTLYFVTGLNGYVDLLSLSQVANSLAYLLDFVIIFFPDLNVLSCVKGCITTAVYSKRSFTG